MIEFLSRKLKSLLLLTSERNCLKTDTKLRSLANKTTPNKSIKDFKKEKEEKEVINFNQNLVDVINTVNDSILPTYGVEIIGANLKINIPETQSNENSQTNLHSPHAGKGITTTRDDETGLVRAKALPYTFNPKLLVTTTRKDYLENGIVGKSHSMMKNYLKTKNKSKHNYNHSHQESKERLEHHKPNSRINTDRIDAELHFTSQQTPIQTTSIEETIDLLKSNRIKKPFEFLPSIRISSQQARKLLYEQNDMKSPNQSVIDYASSNINQEGRKRLNMSMIISSKSKLTSQIPSNRDNWLTKSKIFEQQVKTRDVRDSFRESVVSSNSEINDRLVDYKNDKNKRRNNLSIHEQFNQDILENSDTWGDYISKTKGEIKPKTSKYSSYFSKHSQYGDFMMTKRRVLNKKRRDFWNLSINDKRAVQI